MLLSGLLPSRKVMLMGVYDDGDHLVTQDTGIGPYLSLHPRLLVLRE
jgi:hypothetical protein